MEVEQQLQIEDKKREEIPKWQNKTKRQM